MNEDWSYRRAFVKVPEALIALLARHPETLAVYLVLLQRARYRGAGTTLTKHGPVHLDVGQCVYGRAELAAAINLSERSVRTALDWLANVGILTIKATKRGSIATLCRFKETYPVEDAGRPTGDQPGDQQATNRRPTGDQQTTTNSDLRETDLQTGDARAQTARASNPAVDASALRIAQTLRDLLERNIPAGRTKSNEGDEGDVQEWACDLERLNIDRGIAYETIERVVVWAHTNPDPFWQSLITSGSSVRDKFSTMHAQMLTRGARGEPNHERNYDDSAGLYTGAEEQA